MKTCPMCGKFLNNSLVHGDNKVRLIWHCGLCGYVGKEDRSGLTYGNVVDRYGLNNKEKKYDEL